MTRQIRTETGTDLAVFLLARIAEDEVNAREIVHPRRVMAECVAKRQIVGLHGAVPDEIGALFCGTCRSDASPYGVEWPCTTLRLLALPYIDHHDYCDASKVDPHGDG